MPIQAPLNNIERCPKFCELGRFCLIDVNFSNHNYV